MPQRIMKWKLQVPSRLGWMDEYQDGAGNPCVRRWDSYQKAEAETYGEEAIGLCRIVPEYVIPNQRSDGRPSYDYKGNKTPD